MRLGRSLRIAQPSTSVQIGMAYVNIATREVAAAIWAKALNRLKATTLRIEAARTCSQALPNGTRRLRPDARQIANSDTVPMNAVAVRMLNGGISLSAIFIIGQVSPQIRQSNTSIRRGRRSLPMAACFP